MLPSSPWTVQVGRLRCLRGVETLTAVGMCAEVGDFERFARPEQLMSDIGLVPCESTLASNAAWARSQKPAPGTRDSCWSRPPGTSAPRGALLYPRRSRDELEGRFVGLMAYPDPRGERNNRMPAKRWSAQVSGPGCRGTRLIWRLDLPESQSPDDAKARPSERHPIPAPALRRPGRAAVATLGAWSVVQRGQSRR
jgi:hypothetical protein